MSRVEFHHDEIVQWATEGVRRAAGAMDRGRRGAHGFNRHFERWQIDIEGVLAEAAAAKALGLPYVPLVGALDTKAGDVAPGVQVRSTKYESGSLLVHDSDADDDRFILVTGIYGVYTCRGWIFGREGKDAKYTKTYKGRTAYWVPQSALRPFRAEDLLDHLPAVAA